MIRTGPNRRLTVVSYKTGRPFSARGIRTRELVRVLERDWDVDLLGGPEKTGSMRSAAGLRRVLRGVRSSLLIDRQEPWSRARFRHWSPESDLALVVGSPFSVLAEATARLRELAVPYVPDVGDPWVLTAKSPAVKHLALARARRSEEKVWRGASAAIVTTRLQADRLREYLGDRPILVRPNGFPAELLARPGRPDARPPMEGVLRLMHFGTLYGARIDVWQIVARLAEEGPWESVEFHQFGPSWSGRSPRLPRAVRLVHREPIPWAAAVREAEKYHAAVVVGSRDPAQLPSKAISYLTLPLPRVAFVGDRHGDSIAEYVRDKPGWLVVDWKAAGWTTELVDHVSQRWDSDRLAPPESEAWDRVGEEVSSFLAMVAEGEDRAPEPVPGGVEVARR